jgi:hypothetical protein
VTLFPSMTMILILAVALAFGVSIRSRWAVLLPVSVGVLWALALALTGHNLSDTPIPFVTVVSTLALAAGMRVRSRLLSPVS